MPAKLCCFKRLLKIREDIVNMLDANGKAHITRGHAGLHLLFRGQLGMGRRAG